MINWMLVLHVALGVATYHLGYKLLYMLLKRLSKYLVHCLLNKDGKIKYIIE